MFLSEFALKGKAPRRENSAQKFWWICWYKMYPWCKALWLALAKLFIHKQLPSLWLLWKHWQLWNTIKYMKYSSLFFPLGVFHFYLNPAMTQIPHWIYICFCCLRAGITATTVRHRSWALCPESRCLKKFQSLVGAFLWIVGRTTVPITFFGFAWHMEKSKWY